MNYIVSLSLVKDLKCVKSKQIQNDNDELYLSPPFIQSYRQTSILAVLVLMSNFLYSLPVSGCTKDSRVFRINLPVCKEHPISVMPVRETDGLLNLCCKTISSDVR